MQVKRKTGKKPGYSGWSRERDESSRGTDGPERAGSRWLAGVGGRAIERWDRDRLRPLEKERAELRKASPPSGRSRLGGIAWRRGRGGAANRASTRV